MAITKAFGKNHLSKNNPNKIQIHFYPFLCFLFKEFFKTGIGINFYAIMYGPT